MNTEYALECIDADGHGLTLGKLYTQLTSYGGYYEIVADDGKVYSKYKDRFKKVVPIEM